MAENSVRFPRFFKVFLSETSSEFLAIPLSFMGDLADPLPPTAKLQGIGGGTWLVGLSKIRDGAYFTTGWSKFAEDHRLKSGEFMTFVYDAHDTFEVSVFGRSSCKEIRAVADVIELSDSGVKEESLMDTDEVSLREDEDEETNQNIFPLDDDETDTDSENSNTRITANPSFKTGRKRRIYELLIPANVVAEHNLTFGNRINYIDEEGTTSGEKGKWADDRVCFKGWDRICRRNRLRENDTVTCELLHKRKKVHSVKISIKRGPA